MLHIFSSSSALSLKLQCIYIVFRIILTTESNIHTAHIELKLVSFSYSAVYWQLNKTGWKIFLLTCTSDPSLADSTLLSHQQHTMMQLRTLILTSVMLPWILSSAAKDEYMEVRKPKVKISFGGLYSV